MLEEMAMSTTSSERELKSSQDNTNAGLTFSSE
jgi:hypothetical protein